MGADVGKRSALSLLRRVDSPRGLLPSQLLVRDHKEVLQILDDDLPDAPQLARSAEMAGVPHLLISRVVMGHRKNEPGLFYQANQFQGIRHAMGHGLVAHDVKARLQERFGNRKVEVIGRDDSYKVDALVWR